MMAPVIASFEKLDVVMKTPLRTRSPSRLPAKVWTSDRLTWFGHHSPARSSRGSRGVPS